MAFLGLHLSSGAHVASEAVMGVLMHLTKSITYDGRNAMVAVRSIGDPEGGAPGYAVVYCRGDDLAVSYRSVDDVGPVVVVTHPRQRLLATSPRHIVIGPDQVSARIWSAVPVWAARYSIDDGPWTGLQLSDDGHCHGQPPSNNLAKGIHRLEVVAVTTDGTEGSQRIEFMVDPTGRYTAVPGVSPMVHSTAFC